MSRGCVCASGRRLPDSMRRRTWRLTRSQARIRSPQLLTAVVKGQTDAGTMSLQREGYRSVSGLPHRERGKRKPTEVLAVNEQYALMITGFPLFHGFTLDGARMLLDCGEVKEYRTDEVLFKEGDSPTFVLLVLTGKMQVFVERQPRDLLLTDAGPGTILGELAVLCGIPRSASVRASEKSAILQWSAPAFRSLLHRDAVLSERIFRESLRTLIEKEQSLIDSLIRSQAAIDQNRFPWDRKNVYDLTSVPVGPFWTWVVYPHLQRLGNVGVLEGGYGKGRFLLNAPLDRRWSLIGVDCDEVAFRALQELISAKPNRTDIALCGDLVKGDLNLQAYNIEACVGMFFFHTLSHDGQLAVLRRMYELLPAAGCVYAGFLSTGSWRYEALAQKPECGEPVNLRKVMELDRVGVYTDLFFSFATESYLLGLGARAGFSRTYVFGTHEGCGWTHLVQKHGERAKQEPWHGVVFFK